MARQIDAPAHLVHPCDPAVGFRFADGRIAKSLAELATVVREAPALAEHHRAHFAPWIRDIVRDAAFALEVERLADERSGESFRVAFLDGARRRLDAAGKLREPKPAARSAAR